MMDQRLEDGKAPALICIGGLPTICLTRQGLANIMVKDCKTARLSGDAWLPSLVFSSNGQGVALAAQEPGFRATMCEADWIHADGQSIVFASRLTKAPLPERIATTDFIHDASQAAVANKLSFFMFGGSEKQNEAATLALQEMYPDLIIAGRRSGYFRTEDEEDICAQIRAAKPDILWIGLGKPLQEQWSVRNRHRLNGVGWIKTCGGLYAFLAGDAPRAPQWMQNLGLEWLFRTIKEPRRLGWRYLTTNPYSFYHLIAGTRRIPLDPKKQHGLGQKRTMRDELVM